MSGLSGERRGRGRPRRDQLRLMADVVAERECDPAISIRSLARLLAVRRESIRRGAPPSRGRQRAGPKIGEQRSRVARDTRVRMTSHARVAGHAGAADDRPGTGYVIDLAPALERLRAELRDEILAELRRRHASVARNRWAVAASERGSSRTREDGGCSGVAAIAVARSAACGGVGADREAARPLPTCRGC